MYIKNQKFLVLGVSKSGYSAGEYILKNGGACYLYEDLRSPKITDAINKLLTLGAEDLSGEDKESIMNKFDILVISPGAPINHELAVMAKEHGKRILGELEFGFLQFAPVVIAVTGTNGKTTTATLIDEILRAGKFKTQLVGNVGVPVTKKINEVDKDTICVAEVSSFQLESVNSFCPHISCILNISPDHLERHYTMENYIFLKKRIFKNQRESEYSVLNYDDATVRSCFTDIHAKVLWVSLNEQVDGAYRKEHKLYYKNEFIMNEDELKLQGDHNTYDALFAICCGKLMNISNADIVNALKNFKGVKHRIQLVAEKNGIKYINDSKATNTASTINAINTIKSPVILILGGSDKGENYNSLFTKIKESNVKEVILTGATRFSMLDCAGKAGVNNITVTGDFYNAVKIANLLAVSGDSILLSPATGSFDRFSNFEERGDEFIRLVGEFN